MSTSSSQRKTEMRDGELCPLLKKECARHQCAWFLRLSGLDPQSGETQDKYMCAIVAQVIVVLEGNKETRQAAAAVESLRNVQAKAGERVGEALENFKQPRAVIGHATTDR